MRSPDVKESSSFNLKDYNIFEDDKEGNQGLVIQYSNDGSLKFEVRKINTDAQKSDIQSNEREHYHSYLNRIINEERSKLNITKINEIEYAKEYITNLYKNTKNYLEKPVLKIKKGAGKKNEIRCACLFPDHSKIIYVSKPRNFEVFSIEKSDKVVLKEIDNLKKLHDLNFNILSLALSRDGKMLLYGGTKGKVGLITISEATTEDSQEQVNLEFFADFSDHEKGPIKNFDVRVVRFSRNDEDILIGRDDGQLIIYKNVTKKDYRDSKPEKADIIENLHTDGLSSMAISPVYSIISTGGNDKKIKILEYSQSCIKTISTISSHSGIVSALYFSSDGALLLSGSYDCTAKLFDTSNWKEIITYRGHKEKIYAVAISPDKNFVLTGSADKYALLHDRISGHILAKYVDKAGGLDIRVVLFVSNGSIIFTCGQEGALNFYSIAQGQNIVKHSRHGDGKEDQSNAKRIFSIDIFKDKILTGGEDSTVRMFDMTTGFEIKRFLGHENSVYTVAFSSNGRWALSAGDEGILRIFDVITGSLLRSHSDHTDYINVAIFSPSNKEIITGGVDQIIIVYDRVTGERLHTFPYSIMESKYRKSQNFNPENMGIKDPNVNENELILDITKSSIALGTVNCIQIFEKNDENYIISGGQLRDSEFSVINIYKYSREKAEEVRRIQIKITSEYGINNLCLISLKKQKNILAVNVPNNEGVNETNEIYFYDLENLISRGDEVPELTTAAKAILDLSTYPEYTGKIANFAFFGEDDSENLSFLLMCQLKENEFKYSFAKYSSKLSFLQTNVLTRSDDYGAHFTDGIPLKIIHSFKGPEYFIFDSSEGIPKILNINDKKQHPFRNFSSEISALAISEDSKYTAIAYKTESAEIRIIDNYTGKIDRIIERPQQVNPQLLKFIKNNEKLLIFDDKNSVFVLDFENNPKTISLQNYGEITCLEYFVDQYGREFLFFGSKKGGIFLWDIFEEGSPRICLGENDKLEDPLLILSPFTEEISIGVYACLKSGAIIKLQTNDDNYFVKTNIIFELDQELNCAKCSNDQAYLITGGSDKCVRILEFKNLQEKVFKVHSAPVCSVDFLFQTSHAVSASITNELKIFEVESGRVIYSFTDNNNIKFICAYPQYDTVMLGTDCGLRILERVINSRERLLRFTKTYENIENIDLSTYCFTPEDINISPVPLNISLLNISTILSKDKLDIISSASENLSNVSKQNKEVLLDAIFRADEIFGMSSWDWWINLLEDKKNRNSYVDFLNILAELLKILTDSEEMKNIKNRKNFIQHVALYFPGKLFNLLKSSEENIEIPSINKNTKLKQSISQYPVIIMGNYPDHSERHIHMLLENNYKRTSEASSEASKIEEDLNLFKCTLSPSEFLSYVDILSHFPSSSPVFGLKSLKILTNFLWDELIKKYFLINMIVYIGYLLLVCINLLWVFPMRNSEIASKNSDNEEVKPFFKLSIALNALTMFYIIAIFLPTEINSIRKTFAEGIGRKLKVYISSIWNIIDFFLILIGILSTSLDYAQIFKPELGITTAVKYFYALFLFLSWIRFAELARGFNQTSALIRLLSRVFKDMFGFLVILFLAVFGFALPSFLLQTNYQTLNPWNYIKIFYSVMLGDFGGYQELDVDSSFSEDVFFLIFLIITVFLVVVMLNLLIAIISDSFEKVMAVDEQVKAYDKLQLIAEISRNISESKMGKFVEDYRSCFLYIIEKDSGNSSESIEERIRTKIDRQEMILRKVEKNVEEQTLEQEKIRSTLNEIAKISTLDEKLDSIIDEKLGGLENKLTRKIDEKIGNLDSKIERKLDEKLEELEEKLDTIEKSIDEKFLLMAQKFETIAEALTKKVQDGPRSVIIQNK